MVDYFDLCCLFLVVYDQCVVILGLEIYQVFELVGYCMFGMCLYVFDQWFVVFDVDYLDVGEVVVVED